MAGGDLCSKFKPEWLISGLKIGNHKFVEGFNLEEPHLIDTRIMQYIHES